MRKMKNFVIARTVTLRKSEKGQGYVEYLLIIVFIGLAVTAGLVALAGGINNAFSGIAGTV
jgi:Flp pilus assembly pilin Flp